MMQKSRNLPKIFKILIGFKQIHRNNNYIINMSGKQITAILIIIAVAAMILNHQASPVKSEFQLWKQNFGVKFESMFEEAYRERVFLENLAKINLHNSNELKTYEQGVNKFTGLTQEEFQQTYLGLVIDTSNIVKSVQTVLYGDIDWVSQGLVTPVKDQGNCGSCWAFSATGALEALSKLAVGTLQSFSEQQLVDCSGSYGNFGCNGGLMDNAFKFVMNQGIVTEAEYPYRAAKQTCKMNTGAFKISGYTDIQDCNTLANALTQRPISIAVDASNWSSYKTGVFGSCQSSLNHGVLLVGISNGNWRIKNSWGLSWGQAGYIRLATGNTCGMCNAASYPIIK